MSKYTQEPWILFEDAPRVASINAKNVRPTTYGTYISNSLTDDRGDFFNQYDAERIVACVNACAGMIDPENEIALLKKLAGFANE